MAAIFILAGGVFGFASAIASLILLDASLMLALAIWSGAGLTVVVLGLSLSLLNRRAALTRANRISAEAHPV
ncbi:hypothetical protein [Pseudotabrizicola alkalilacus]|uniref:Uncharacterized protein n=1 Tax=Pseudotabrizicola alkalilacus TaxID=2305252 RepID=A0A411Z5V6_9RHOB|nr:hypothetical protein [Pseudotabrizicola alkalilacus]RGP38402.1 hypothetical protein D1012_06190 [Pseudotabrizicola alkalilacus]